MRGIIVLDGPDACGKTTLAKVIQERCEQLGIQYKYIHAEYRFKDKMFQYHEAIVRRAIKFSQEGIVIIDRLYWSEYVYGKVFRGGSKWPLQWRYFDRLLSKHCAMNVICVGNDPLQVLEWHRLAKAERSEMYDRGLDEVAAEYIGIYNRNYGRQDYMHYHRNHCPDQYTRYVFADTIFDGLQNLQNTQMPSALKPDSYNLLGHVQRAKYLFLGDELNNKGRHQIWPFWEYKHSSLFLTKVLDSIGFNEIDAVWTNYHCNPEQFYLYDILEYNPNITVVSLGIKQANLLKGLKKVSVFHPSYARRFNVTDYAQQLKDALNYA